MAERSPGPVRRAGPVPTVLQMEAAECGAACLAMVLAAFGRWETLDSVRDSCGVSRDGVSAADIVEAAGRRGLEASAYSREVEELAELPLPQILFWDFNHFVVLEAVGRRGFTVNDPAHGRREIGREEFGRRFTGVTLAFRPGPEFRPTPRPQSTSRRLAGLLRGSGGMFASVILTSFTMVALGVLVPGLTRVFVDDYLVQGRGDWLLPLLGGLIAVGALRAALAAVYTRGLLLLQTKIGAAVSAVFVWRLFRLPYEFFVRRSAVEISSRPQLAAQLAGIASGPMAQMATHLLAMLGYLLVMLAYDLWLTGVMVLFAVLEFSVLRLMRKRVEERAVHLQMAAGQAHAAAVQGTALLEQARAGGGEGLLFNRMLEAQARLVNSEQENGRTIRLLAALPYLGSRATTLALLGVGALLVIKTEMTLGTLLGFLMLASLFSSALSALTGISTAIGQSSAAIGRLGDALDHGATGAVAEADRSADEAPAATARIRLRDLAFGYSNGEVLLRDLQLSVEPGESVGIMGASGSGKSTLARLLTGLVTPLGGEVSFESRAGDWRPAGLGVGYVDQQPFLPAGSLRAALTLWNDKADNGEIQRALDDAEIAEAVASRPGGVDGLIGEGGGGFSGGERQRLALARALVVRPDILILDDATSALDEETEARILGNLRRRGVTVILLTNRASAIRHLDRVEGLHQGRLFPLDIEGAYQASEGAAAALREVVAEDA